MLVGKKKRSGSQYLYSDEDGKLNASKLPQYFNSYKPYLEKNETKYNLRPNPLVVPAVNHVYAENLLIYRLVKLKNIFSLHYLLVDDKLNDETHSLVGFGRYIAKVIIDKYSYQCSNNPCLHVVDYK